MTTFGTLMWHNTLRWQAWQGGLRDWCKPDGQWAKYTPKQEFRCRKQYLLYRIASSIVKEDRELVAAQAELDKARASGDA